MTKLVEPCHLSVYLCCCLQDSQGDQAVRVTHQALSHFLSKTKPSTEKLKGNHQALSTLSAHKINNPLPGEYCQSFSPTIWMVILWFLIGICISSAHETAKVQHSQALKQSSNLTWIRYRCTQCFPWRPLPPPPKKKKLVFFSWYFPTELPIIMPRCLGGSGQLHSILQYFRSLQQPQL